MLNLPRIYSISTNSIPFHCSKYVVPSIDRTGTHLSGFTHYLRDLLLVIIIQMAQ